MKDDIIVENLNLIHFTIKKMRLYWKNEDEYNDFYNDGLIGLINGVRTFDESKDLKLSTYLYVCISNSIKAGMHYNNSLKRKTDKRIISLNMYINEEQDEQLIDFIPDNKTNIEKEIIRKQQIEDIIYILEKCETYRNIAIFKLYYGLDGFPERTGEEISEYFNISYQRVRIILRTIENKIKYFINHEEKLDLLYKLNNNKRGK